MAGDTLSKIAPQTQWEIIMRVNRVDERHLPLGKTIFLPADMEKAEKFLPIPENISEMYQNGRLIYVVQKDQFFGVYEKGSLFFGGRFLQVGRNTRLRSANSKSYGKRENIVQRNMICQCRWRSIFPTQDILFIIKLYPGSRPRTVAFDYFTRMPENFLNGAESAIRLS